MGWGWDEPETRLDWPGGPDLVLLVVLGHDTLSKFCMAASRSPSPPPVPPCAHTPGAVCGLVCLQHQRPPVARAPKFDLPAPIAAFQGFPLAATSQEHPRCVSALCLWPPLMLRAVIQTGRWLIWSWWSHWRRDVLVWRVAALSSYAIDAVRTRRDERGLSNPKKPPSRSGSQAEAGGTPYLAHVRRRRANSLGEVPTR